MLQQTIHIHPLRGQWKFRGGGESKTPKIIFKGKAS